MESHVSPALVMCLLPETQVLSLIGTTGARPGGVGSNFDTGAAQA